MSETPAQARATPAPAETAGETEGDRDRDGIPDAEDECRDAPETVNGYQDRDGCPDRGSLRRDPPKKARPDECSACWSPKCPELAPYLPPCD